MGGNKEGFLLQHLLHNTKRIKILGSRCFIFQSSKIIVPFLFTVVNFGTSSRIRYFQTMIRIWRIAAKPRRH